MNEWSFIYCQLFMQACFRYEPMRKDNNSTRIGKLSLVIIIVIVIV